MTFFRSFEQLTWIDVAPSDDPGDVASRIVEVLEVT